ncbi:hypothetical protein L6164_022538 [Bauhinia variegata]|uniref:Uncharacterized protein n=1 Tax=Bauhinia variegata TaxID=167791 RepID=A0ACB9MFJ7_BAUVA|nr:hypothetical protein L6164_022538 [Bauhinia variegata]
MEIEAPFSLSSPFPSSAKLLLRPAKSRPSSFPRKIEHSLVKMNLESGNALDQMMDSGAATQPKQQNQTWNEEKEAAVHQEIRRMNQLPSNSTYAVHRLRVLNKILQLMSIQITGGGDGVAFCFAVPVKQFVLIVASSLPWPTRSFCYV